MRPPRPLRIQVTSAIAVAVGRSAQSGSGQPARRTSIEVGPQGEDAVARMVATLRFLP